MLHAISYDLIEPNRDYAALRNKIDSLGDAYYCLKSMVLLQTAKTAGEVDSAIREVVGDNALFLVLDITGADEKKYYGRIVAQEGKGGFWTWLASHNS